MLTNEGFISFVVGGATAIPAGARVKLETTNPMAVVVAGIADNEIGTAILHSGKDSYAVGDAIGVKLINAPGTRHVIASEAIAVGAVLLRAADGKVGDTGAGLKYGIALEAASADGDLIEAITGPGISVIAA